MSNIAVLAKGVGYRAGSRRIISNISLVLNKGEFVGLLGASGSGKTTLMTCLNGMKEPTDGSVVLNDAPGKKRDDQRRLIGYVPQQDIVHATLRVERALYYSCLLRLSMDEEKAQGKVEQVLESLAMTEHRRTRIRSLSGGQRKRVNIGIELLHSPPLFFLDEPTAGLDPALERQLMKLLKTLAGENRLVLVTTHLMQHADLFDQVIFLHQGRMIYFGPASDITSYFQVQSMVQIFEKTQSHDSEWMERRFLNSETYHTGLARRLAESRHV